MRCRSPCHAMLRRGCYQVAMILRAWIIRAGGLSRQILRVTSNIALASRRHVSTALESNACQLRLSFPTAYSLRNSSASSGISYAPAEVRTSAAAVISHSVANRAVFAGRVGASKSRGRGFMPFGAACHKVRGTAVSGPSSLCSLLGRKK